ncbi:MAG TPA: carboxypeptidase-like regulatory domain-containing protein, partial [Planctomycetota bacterium]|nr:carboxypeptidase-like regulatory domain-containing protein [Planctomycetota bacterium]
MALPSKAAEVRGRVVDVRGGALAGARIVLSRGDRVIAETTTGADGAFSFAPVPADDELPLIVAAEVPRMVRRTDWWRAGGGPIELVLHAAVALRGCVVDETGAPLRGVE